MIVRFEKKTWRSMLHHFFLYPFPLSYQGFVKVDVSLSFFIYFSFFVKLDVVLKSKSGFQYFFSIPRSESEELELSVEHFAPFQIVIKYSK
jgi:hypothetical protein